MVIGVPVEADAQVEIDGVGPVPVAWPTDIGVLGGQSRFLFSEAKPECPPERIVLGGLPRFLFSEAKSGCPPPGLPDRLSSFLFSEGKSGGRSPGTECEAASCAQRSLSVVKLLLGQSAGTAKPATAHSTS